MEEARIGRNIKHLRELHRMTQDEVAHAIGASDKAVSAWERGEREPRMGYVQKMAELFNVEIESLMDGSIDDVSEQRSPTNIFQIKRRMIPVLGNIAAGVPIWADEEHDEFVDDNGTTTADFALRVKGDSMAPLIEDGDFVYVKRQSEVRNGQIAVVLDGDSATLKYFYSTDNGVTLSSHNPEYQPIVYRGIEASELHIEGLAVAFKRSLIR